MLNPQSLFVTGTDTEIGKTTAACALARGWVRGGAQVGAMKPVAAGLVNGVSEDLLALETSCNIRFERSLACQYALAEPIAPHLAAARAGMEIRAEAIAQSYRKLRADQNTHILIEGAGGALVPLNNCEDMLDIALACNLPVVLVVGMKLGCINHARLTEAAILARGLACAGWVANVLNPNMPFLHENLETLKTQLSSPFQGVCGWKSAFLSAKL